MRLLDLFCGAGGAATGYHHAGFNVTGVDIKAQPQFPFEFHQADAVEFLLQHGKDFDVIHASPPCQFASQVTPKIARNRHLNYIPSTRDALLETGKPFIIENVTGARRFLRSPLLLCGSMFNLRSRRHRYFEINPALLMLTPTCDHSVMPLLVTTAGNNSRAIRPVGQWKSVKNAPLAYGIDWMSQKGLAEAIPPAYTEFIGRQLIAALSE